MTTAIIDADVLAFRGASAVEDRVDWDGDGNIHQISDPKEAIKAMRQVLDQWLYVTDATDYRLLLSDKRAARTSFRYLLHPHYKANRKGLLRPVALNTCIEYLFDKLQAEYIPGLEGDDAVGVTATEMDAADCVVISTDKDMLTLPCRVFIVPHMRPLEEGKIREVSIREANRNVFTQAITGDRVDNYLGAPGLGPKAAAKYLGAGHLSESEAFKVVVQAFKYSWDNKPKYHDRWVNPGDPYKEALLNVRMARILRDGDYDMDAKKVRIWEPEGEGKWISPF